MNQPYRLTAELGDAHESMNLYCDNDTDATLDGITRILDAAIHNETWAKGAIALARPDGTVIQTMEAKA